MTSAPKSSHSRTGELTIHTERRTQLLDVTAAITKLVQDAAVHSGVCYLYVPHTTAGVLINENFSGAFSAVIPSPVAPLADLRVLAIVEPETAVGITALFGPEKVGEGSALNL